MRTPPATYLGFIISYIQKINFQIQKNKHSFFNDGNLLRIRLCRELVSRRLFFGGVFTRPLPSPTDSSTTSSTEIWRAPGGVGCSLAPVCHLTQQEHQALE